uniref:Neuronal pentraxin-1-like n=1 Tax=Oryzias melastigma TaxID=30732 RepID=A0A3B3DDU7_ORYME
MEIMRNILFVVFVTASVTSGSEYDYGAHPRFVCTPIPADADPSCFSTTGPGVGTTGSNGPGHQNAPPSSWWGVNDEAKATILHLRESLVQQKEIILDQRETIRELTAKLTMCEGFGRGVSPHSHHHPHTDEGHYSNPPGHHGNGHLHPDSPVYPSSAGGHKSDGVNHQGKEKHMTPGDSTSSTEQMERMLLVLKERLDNLQKRNSSTAYSSSLRDLLQRKISTLEGQLHHHNNPEHHDDDATHRDDGDHPADNHHNDDHKGDAGHEENHTDHHDDDDNQDLDGDHDSHHHDDEEDADHHDNEADSHSYLPHTGYSVPGPRTGPHSNKLETILNQLQLTGSGRKNTQSLDAFQISFPMRTNYMHGRVKRTLLQEIFALTLCLWMKAGVGPGLGTPFSYSAPGQANELVLIEWGNNPIELLIDDKAVTLPLSLSDGKWHHVCVTWTTRDGLWEAYQDGVQKGTGTNLSPWHAIKPGGVFILGQEQVKIKKTQKRTEVIYIFVLDVQLGMILTSDQILTKFMSRLFRTLWGVVLMPPSRTWGRCPSCTCGPAS